MNRWLNGAVAARFERALQSGEQRIQAAKLELGGDFFFMRNKPSEEQLRLLVGYSQ